MYLFQVSTPQNDRLNLSFVKDIYEGAKKTARNGPEVDLCQLQILGISLYLCDLEISLSDSKS